MNLTFNTCQRSYLCSQGLSFLAQLQVSHRHARPSLGGSFSGGAVLRPTFCLEESASPVHATFKSLNRASRFNIRAGRRSAQLFSAKTKVAPCCSSKGYGSCFIQSTGVLPCIAIPATSRASCLFSSRLNQPNPAVNLAPFGRWTLRSWAGFGFVVSQLSSLRLLSFVRSAGYLKR